MKLTVALAQCENQSDHYGNEEALYYRGTARCESSEAKYERPGDLRQDTYRTAQTNHQKGVAVASESTSLTTVGGIDQ
ncbi:hypothetical protein [Nesterenkonia haasae]|uniref:hypothetical protein n=1 Tax=Nesterenkonia haasae TaxID=2587813 RepID=UPI001391B297|nr:hypothetical protein [Nesterenkonia haasae]NDK31199.1 hypothetical protein [Nesterenkonia haasae]